jgi:hypothetical protein
VPGRHFPSPPAEAPRHLPDHPCLVAEVDRHGCPRRGEVFESGLSHGAIAVDDERFELLGAPLSDDPGRATVERRERVAATEPVAAMRAELKWVGDQVAPARGSFRSVRRVIIGDMNNQNVMVISDWPEGAEHVNEIGKQVENINLALDGLPGSHQKIIEATESISHQANLLNERIHSLAERQG